MALILHLETATPTCSVALSEDGKLLSLKEQTARNIHASVITLFIEAMMRDAGRQLADLDAVCVSKGPGSYTGLRIGVSTAKGLCYALEKPLLAVSTLESLAQGFLQKYNPPTGSLLCPALDARRMEVFMAVYRRGTEPSALVSEAAVHASVMDESTLDPWLRSEALYLFGTGAEKCQALYQNKPQVKIITDFDQSAAHLVEPAHRKFMQSQFEDVAYFEPYYLKEFLGTSKRP